MQLSYTKAWDMNHDIYATMDRISLDPALENVIKGDVVRDIKLE